MSMIGTWTQRWEISNSLNTTQDSRKCRWMELELGHEKSATHWTLLNFQKFIDDWDLHLSLRDQQLIDHHSRLKKMSMIGTWTHLWWHRQLPTNCGWHPANPLPWHWHEHPAWTSTCMGKDNIVAFTRNTCRLLLQLGKHCSLVRQCLQIWLQLLTWLQPVWPHPNKTSSVITQ